MRIIDIHTHAWPDEVAAKALPALVAAGDGLVAHYDGTVVGLLGEMGRTRVGVSVIQPVATRPGQVAGINDWAASQASDGIVAFGAMHPDFGDPPTEIARMRSLGLCGFKMHPEHQSFAPDDPRMASIYEAAVKHGMIVFFHAGADVIHPTIHGTPASFAAVMDRWPDLTAVLAHLGGFREWEAVAEHVAGRDVWLDTAYTIGHLPDDELVALVRAHGPERVLFGSDGPWTDAAKEIAHLRGLPFTAEELDGVLGGNAARLLASAG
jgi:predicted TIM-barrel fold metal-dependent hydrolase